MRDFCKFFGVKILVFLLLLLKKAMQFFSVLFLILSFFLLDIYGEDLRDLEIFAFVQKFTHILRVFSPSLSF